MWDGMNPIFVDVSRCRRNHLGSPLNSFDVALFFQPVLHTAGLRNVFV